MDIEKLKALEFPQVEQPYTKKDSMIYALGLGYGSRPLDPDHLRFLYEEGIEAVPSMVVVLGYPGFWLKDPELKADWVRMLHGEHYFEMHRPLPAEGKVVSSHRIIAVDDKGTGKGALIYLEKVLRDAQGSLLTTVRQTLFLRADGGCGGFGEVPAAVPALPERQPDRVLEIATYPHSALLYRLNGDWNPIHADPATAQQAGFEQPILHGLCSMGLACRAILEAYCGGDPARFGSLFVRFSKPVFPGETIRYEFYEAAGKIGFRAQSVERGITVLDRCTAAVL